MACPGEIRHVGSRETPKSSKSVRGHTARCGNVYHLEERREKRERYFHCSENKTDTCRLIKLTCPACIFLIALTSLLRKAVQLLKSNTITWTRSIILNHNWKWSSGESWHQKVSMKPSHNRYHKMFSSCPWRISPRPPPNWSPYLSHAQESCRAWLTKGILCPWATRFQIIKS